ncbi:segregation and condensation protein B [Serinicoccus chungangensis]|uniref:Segregation and condensation protein B n=1 Tax=Serinicoccus chungangensis TaxID=767452 RepID=A0A0W8I7K6_9MICO|nr:SMC-Scp complex subunit ScpB [Serinicoccus chungangensis]KUG54431.1 segregation and condensation protein B [Serinicoccus chungangensis]
MSRPDEEQEQPGVDVRSLPGGVRSAVEAVLMVIDEPVTEEALAGALELPLDEVGAALDALAQEYAEGQRGFMLRRLGGGWRIYSRPEYAPVVERFLLGGQQARLTQAALETLAVIAYRQPISRARIGAIRGVNVDGVVRTLLARGMVTEVGQDPTGGAVLYGTTDLFLQRMGLDSLDELPALAPYLPSAEVLEELASEGLA